MKYAFGLLFLLVTLSANAEEGLIKASGFGAADLTKIPLEQQAILMAKRAAKVDAQRNLVEQVKGLRLTGGTTMEDFEVSTDIVATRVKNVLKGAFQVDEKITKDKQSIVVEVTMAVCVNNFHEKCTDRPTLDTSVITSTSTK